MQGNTVFDRASVQPPPGAPAKPASVNHRLQRPVEVIYRRNIERVKTGAFPSSQHVPPRFRERAGRLNSR
jgi:hypothetical protein